MLGLRDDPLEGPPAPISRVRKLRPLGTLGPGSDSPPPIRGDIGVEEERVRVYRAEVPSGSRCRVCSELGLVGSKWGVRGGE